MKHKQLARYVIISLLILGIFIGIYLVQRTQIISPQASPAPPTAVEREYNPFGDTWSTKKRPHSSMIRAALTTGCYRSGSKSNQSTPSPEEINFWSKSNTGFVFEECAIFSEDARTKQYYKSLTSSLAPSTVNYVGYGLLLQADINTTGISAFYNAAEQKPVAGYEDFFLYKADGTLAKFGGSHPMLNMTSGRYRAFIIPKMVDYMNRTGMGGVLIDSMYSAENLRTRGTLDLTQLKSTANTAGESLLNWNAYVIDFMRDLNVAMDQGGRDRLLFANVDGTDTAFIEGLLPYIDGIMLEDPLGQINTDFASRAKRLAPVLDKAAELNKYVLVVVNNNINCTNPGALSCYNEFVSGMDRSNRELSDYYLAGYLNLQRNDKTVLLYYTPTSAGPQFVSSAFFRSWDLKLGSPVGGSTEVAPGVYLRKFQNAFVYFNNSYQDYKITNVDRLYSPEGTPIDNAVVPFKTGRIYVTNAVLSEWNTPEIETTVTVQPSPSVTPTPLPSAPPNVLSPSPTALPATPRPVTLKPIAVTCVSRGYPRVTLTWTGTSASIYKVFMRDMQNTNNEIQVGITNTLSWNIESSNGLLPGHSYEFVIAAETFNGSVYSDNGWSRVKYGWTQIPNCR